MSGSRAGALVAVGGAEDKVDAMVVLRRVLEHAAMPRRIAILPTASRDPEAAAQPHVEAFHRMGLPHVDVVDVRSPQDAAQADVLARIAHADLVYMTGGDQARLSAVLAHTPLLKLLRERHEAGAVVGGTSAGAAALSTVMIAQGESRLRKGSVRLMPGLGLVDGLIIDTHFSERDRFARLFEAVATHPAQIGIGLGEDTAVVIRGHSLDVVGAGSVVIMDPREVRASTLHDVEPDEPYHVERMVVHTLAHGQRYRWQAVAPTVGARRAGAKS